MMGLRYWPHPEPNCKSPEKYCMSQVGRDSPYLLLSVTRKAEVTERYE